MSRIILFILVLLGSLATSAEHSKSMNKNDLVAYVVGRTSLSHAQAAEAVNAVFDGITETLADGGDIRLGGFGNFSVRRRGEREGRNPRTGDRVVVAARNVPTFKAGRD